MALPVPGRTAKADQLHDVSPAHTKGLCQVLGLDPRIALVTLVIDTMLFGGELVTLGTSVVLSLAVGLVLAFIAYRAQLRWYGDDRESALIKALILGLLTAIPTSLPAFMYLPAGVFGLIHKLRNR